MVDVDGRLLFSAVFLLFFCVRGGEEAKEGERRRDTQEEKRREASRNTQAFNENEKIRE